MILSEKMKKILKFTLHLVAVLWLLPHTIGKIELLSAELECLETSDPIQLIPLNEIWKDIQVANRYDPDAKAAFDFIGSANFRAKLDKLESSGEFQAFIELCKAKNIRIPEILTYIKNEMPNFLMKLNKMPSSAEVNTDEITGGVHGLVMRIFVNRLPIDAIEESFKALQECDDQYKEKISNLQSAEFKAALSKLQSSSEYKSFFAELDDHNIFLDIYLNFILKFLDVKS